MGCWCRLLQPIIYTRNLGSREEGALRRFLSKGTEPVFIQGPKKTTEKSKRLCLLAPLSTIPAPTAYHLLQYNFSATGGTEQLINGYLLYIRYALKGLITAHFDYFIFHLYTVCITYAFNDRDYI